MDFKQAENKFEKLKAQFTAGKISESEFKAQLKELMIQDKHDNWWMLGYETEQWYRHDGKDWVQADPPGSSSKVSTPPPLKQEIGTSIPKTNLDDQKPVWKFGRREITLSIIGIGVFIFMFILVLLFGFGSFFSFLNLALVVPLIFGLVFGSKIGATVGAGSYISSILIFINNRYSINLGFFLDFFQTSALIGAAIAGFIMGYAKIPSNNSYSPRIILRIELFVVLASLVLLLLSIDLRVLIYDFYSVTANTDFWSALIWRLILVPTSLIVFWFILSRRKAKD